MKNNKYIDLKTSVFYPNYLILVLNSKFYTNDKVVLLYPLHSMVIKYRN